MEKALTRRTYGTQPDGLVARAQTRDTDWREPSQPPNYIANSTYTLYIYSSNELACPLCSELLSAPLASEMPNCAPRLSWHRANDTWRRCASRWTSAEGSNVANPKPIGFFAARSCKLFGDHKFHQREGPFAMSSLGNSPRLLVSWNCPSLSSFFFFPPTRP